MKKIFIYGVAALAGIFSLTNCTKEAAIETPAAGVPFEIYAGSAEVTTKTTIDGFSTSWAAKDSINLFHAVSGTTTYQNDGNFTVADPASGKFTGTLATALESGENYDWYALYPYKVQVTSPVNTNGYSQIGSRSDKSQTQNGANSTTHLAGYNYPLYGKSSAPTAGAEVPSITLKPAFSVVEIEVKNSTASNLSVASILFTAPEAIIGAFCIDFSGDTPAYTAFKDSYVTSTASLSVTGDATIAANASAKFYLAVKPFTAASGSTLKISVNGYEKSLKLTSDATFTAGKIKTLSFNYDKVSESGTSKVYYTKVTSKSDLTNGQYLIVYENKSVVFNGSLGKLDVNDNNQIVTINDNKIEATTDIDKWAFTLDSSKGSLKSSNGFYIGATKDDNKLESNTTTVYTNTISIENNGDCTIKGSGGAFLRYNDASNQNRFRYYKSSTYKKQKAIQIYKRSE